ncbi:MAG: sigma 54-interacting transcriptional regulator [Methylococcaceae bacterium]|nr:sigma 54-interacting transcriptional regulator [Methylococcaceae bacterium]
MPLETQAMVLRAIQKREIVRVGEAEEIPVDIRLVCATSRDLATRIASGDFREDLLYRINTVTITMPPLRKRPGDIAPLARACLDKFSDNISIPQLVDGRRPCQRPSRSPINNAAGPLALAAACPDGIKADVLEAHGNSGDKPRLAAANRTR